MNIWPKKIPKDIYITCKNKSDYSEILLKNLLEENPGFTINIYGDKECINFLDKYFGKDYVNFFDTIPDGAIKADFWRACILYIFGGIYLDADVIMKIPLIKLIDRNTYFVTSGSKDKNRMNPIIIISEKENKILKETIESIYNCRNEKYNYWKYSICVHMKPIIDKYIPNYKENISETYIIDKKKYKFLKEVFLNKKYGTYYKGKLIMYNHNKIFWKRNIGFIQNKKIAILIPGELRFFNKEYLNIFINKLKEYDIFISTYKKYENIAKLITKNYIILDESKYNPEQTNLYQWIHLQNLISHYKDKLVEYNILLKFRTDITFQKDFFNKIEPIEKTIYCFTDFIFFGLTEHFLYVFEDIYDKIMKNYWGKDKEYMDINYKNFLNAKIGTFKFMWLRMSQKIISKDFKKLKENILLNSKLIEDKENLRKEKMRTYKNFKENGKFVSEKIIVFHIINYGFIEGISYNIKLFPNRKNYNFFQ